MLSPNGDQGRKVSERSARMPVLCQRRLPIPASARPAATPASSAAPVRPSGSASFPRATRPSRATRACRPSNAGAIGRSVRRRAQATLRERDRLLLARPGRAREAGELERQARSGGELELPAGRDPNRIAGPDHDDLAGSVRRPAPDAALARGDVPDLLHGPMANGPGNPARGQPDQDQAGALAVADLEVDLRPVRSDRVWRHRARMVASSAGAVLLVAR